MGTAAISSLQSRLGSLQFPLVSPHPLTQRISAWNSIIWTDNMLITLTLPIYIYIYIYVAFKFWWSKEHWQRIAKNQIRRILCWRNTKICFLKQIYFLRLEIVKIKQKFSPEWNVSLYIGNSPYLLNDPHNYLKKKALALNNPISLTCLKTNLLDTI